MGCFQSSPAKEVSAAEAAAAAAREEAVAARALAAATPADSAGVQQKRPETAVLRAASAFDSLDAAARAPPKLEEVENVVVGHKSKKLLDGFEAKEAAARAPPVLVSVEKKDLRQSKLFSKLQEYEAKDAAAAAEPKLEKTFAQRQQEEYNRIRGQ